MVSLKKDNYVPIAVICYNRPQHLKKVLNSLLENPESKYSEIYFFIDKFDNLRSKDANQKVIEICKENWEFKKINIFTNKVNKGLKMQIIDSATFMALNHSAFIMLEDDVVVSKNFLHYMNLSLKKYKDSNIFHINGYNYNNFINNPKNAYVSLLMFSWGWATWSDKWLEFVNTPDFDSDKIAKVAKKEMNRFNIYGLSNYYNQIKDNSTGKIRTWAIFWYQHISLNNGYTISPGKSHTINLGFDGSGTNSGRSDNYNTKLNNLTTENFQNKIGIYNSNHIVTIFWSLKVLIKEYLRYHTSKLLRN